MEHLEEACYREMLIGGEDDLLSSLSQGAVILFAFITCFHTYFILLDYQIS